ncbi:O-antigen ligase family protein [Parabacteroides sp.]|uniref:O-antigen ligase family protein n=1 Tax=Parabacteroides sp. TaxID=1869337 RepID=UPI003080AA65
MEQNIGTIQIKFFPILLLLGLTGIVISLLTNNMALLGGLICFPILLISCYQVLCKPIILFLIIFTINYYLMGLTRYVDLSGISFLMDILMVSTLLLIIVHSSILKNIEWKYGFNTLTIGSFAWMLYCLAQIANPSGMLQAWILSRGLIINGFIISLTISLLCVKYKTIKLILFMLSIFALTAFLKAAMQKFIGFDKGEQLWLNRGGALTHLIASGTRYFSFFTDAGNFGSNMGCANVIFTIAACYIKSKPLKIYYTIVAIASLYAMFLSGTRGAMIVPLGGLALFIILSKNIRIIAIGSISLLCIYIFFAFTMIGQNNQQIRRMRTAFTPTEDGSFNVRRENQARLGEYLKNKPFGEGLGLSGVENQKISNRFTTSIPHDSWYVKIWVETGIVGITLYLGFLFISIAHGAWIIMFRIKDKELKGLLSGLLCGITGMLLSAYGNAFWGQYPTHIIAFTGLALVLKGTYFDNEITKENNNKIIQHI